MIHKLRAYRAKLNAALPLIFGANIVILGMVAMDWLLRLALQVSKETALYLSILAVIVTLSIVYRKLLDRRFTARPEQEREEN